MNSYARIGKRCLDIVGSLVGLLLLAPLLPLIALAVRLTSRGPAFYRQARTGQFGKPFRIFKFRTMRAQSSANESLLTAKGDSRITPLGKLLRKSKVDELPQLINVLVGDMSLVGPRPEVPTYAASYTERQKAILREKPGLTGLSSIAYADEENVLASHPNKESFYLETLLPAKLELDTAYCENIRFVEDLRLILVTVSKVLFGAVTARKIARAPLVKHTGALD